MAEDQMEIEKAMNTTPPLKPLISTAERQRAFGKFDYKPNPDGSIKILGNWANKNIVKVYIPQLQGIEGEPKDCMVYFHKLGAEQLKALFEEWDAEGLMDRVLSYAGAFVPRMIRGSRTTLSNHAFGTAFDINAAWNGLGKTPAPKGKKGSVMELVEIAHKHGFYWGGNFSRKDGMHFELAVVQPQPGLRASEISAIQHGAETILEPSEPFQDAALTEAVNELPDAANVQSASTTIQETVTQQVAEGEAPVQTTKTVSETTTSFLEQPKQILKDKSGSLMNWLVGAGTLSTIGAWLKDNQTLIVVSFISLVVVVLTIYFVNKYFKIMEAKIKADKNSHDVEFVKVLRPAVKELNERKEAL